MDELPLGRSAFISAAGTAQPRTSATMVGLFNDFRYKNMTPA